MRALGVAVGKGIHGTGFARLHLLRHAVSRCESDWPEGGARQTESDSKDWEVGLEVVSIVGDANTVIAERVEHFRHKTNAVEPFDLPVVGVFEMADGKIKAWRDYWDKSAAEPLFKVIAMSREQRTT